MRQTSLKLYGAAPSPRPRVRLALRAAWVISIGAVVVGSLLPGTSAPIRTLTSLPISDTCQHFGAYGLLSFLPALHERLRFTLWATCGCLMMGVFLEFAQLLATGRSWDFSDIEADAAGVCFGLLVGLPLRGSPIAEWLLSRTTR